MSLDVYLTQPGQKRPAGPAKIFIRENGGNVELTPEEWSRRYPGIEPVTVEQQNDSPQVYSANITHNLGAMAREAGVYEALWRPDECGLSKAGQLIVPLESGLVNLRAEPEHYRRFNPENGWGTYEGLVRFVDLYLEACRKYPEADVWVCR